MIIRKAHSFSFYKNFPIDSFNLGCSFECIGLFRKISCGITKEKAGVTAISAANGVNYV